jgi:DNA-directed RNA polymerase subunit H
MQNLDYNVKDYENFTNSEVNSMFQNKQLDLLLEKNQEDNKTKRKNKIYIRYYLAKTFRPQNIQEIIDDLYNLEEILTKEDILLIITKDEPNDTLVNAVKHIWEQDGIFIVIQSIKRLQFYILDHVLVPPHRILTSEEAEEVKMKYNIAENSQLPEISRFDPVALAVCVKPGQICEIIRPSKTAIQSKYYRVCV